MKAIDCADYIIKKSLMNHQTITHMQLQKILFLIASEYQRQTSTYPFDKTDRFEAWGYGPVMPSVYQIYHVHDDISPIDTYIRDTFDYQTCQWQHHCLDENQIDDSFKQIVDQYLSDLLQINVFKLVNYTHQQSFWINHSDSKQATYPVSEVKLQSDDTLASLIHKFNQL